MSYVYVCAFVPYGIDHKGTHLADLIYGGINQLCFFLVIRILFVCRDGSSEGAVDCFDICSQLLCFVYVFISLQFCSYTA